MEAPAQKEMALSGRRVLDLTDEKGVYCARILADLGADVIKIERPEGDPTRRLPPFKDDVPNPERSLYFAHFNLNKRGITLNLESADGQAVFKRLVKTADILVESFAPGTMNSWGFGYDILKEINPGLIMASITPFGQTGPYRDYKANDLVCFALAGAMYVSGDPRKPPCVAPGNLAYGMASVYASMGILLALYHRSLTGRGQYIDVSTEECTTPSSDYTIPRFTYEKMVLHREGSGYGNLMPYDIYPCRDGFVRLIAIAPHQWSTLVEWMGKPEPLLDPIWEDQMVRCHNRAFIDGYIKEFTRNFTKAELADEGQRRHLPITPVNTPAEFVEDAQTKAREFFVEVKHPELGCYPYAGPPYKLTETPCQIRHPAPLLGQHNEEIYCGELGYTEEDLVHWRGAGVV